MKPVFTASATAIGGREGRVTSTDGIIDLNVSMPGSKHADEATNPEQLFAAGYAACFGSALNLVISKERVKTEGSSVTGHVTLNQDDEGGFFISVELEVEIKGVDQETAERLVEAAHQVCPYSKATRGNVDVKLTAKAA
ncbi:MULTISPECIES: organic hydroperoxide resistance protein [Exiguobacterium]|uniref:organic hydroperoxide resistance protein n=1 Tax=Exiguobacterium TaxID=33986 RepID=UPI001BE9CF13|nr:MULTISPECIES: organic hydroperoxide resistance protein [Exiguobacterium]MCT4783307.1 organic hydroperoxide resistance protein [Exiguobacterium himgiriensis]